MIQRHTYTDRYVQPDHIKHALDTGNIVAISAQCGMGKSTAINKVLADIQNERSMSITARRVQAIECAKNMDQHLYQNIAHGENEKISTTIHSLQKFKNWVETADKDCVVSLDEIRSNLAAICGSTFSGQHGQLQLLETLMKNATVIAADADLLCDNMCVTFLQSFGRNVELLEYTYKPLPRTVVAVFGFNGGKYWENHLKENIRHNRNIFVHFNSKSRATNLARFCKRQKKSYKLYCADSTNLKDFNNVDEAWQGIQVIIATATITVAIDPQQWHCDLLYIHAGQPGFGCTPRDQGQAASRVGRQGQGDGPGQISLTPGMGEVQILTLFGIDNCSEPKDFDAEALFTANKTIFLQIRNAKRQCMMQTFDAGVASSNNQFVAPDFYTDVQAYDAVEKNKHACAAITEWKTMCSTRGWSFKVKTNTGTDEDSDSEDSDSDEEEINPAANYESLHLSLNKSTETLPKKQSKEHFSKYGKVLDVLKRQDVIDSNYWNGLTPREIFEEINEHDYIDSILTKVAENHRLIQRALTTEEYEFFQDNTSAFYNQRNIRTKTVDELLIMDEDSAGPAETAKLRHGCAVQLFKICRLLDFSLHDVFQMDVEISDEKRKLFEFNCDTEESQEIYKQLCTWAKYRNSTIHATKGKKKSAMRVGLEKIFSNYGIKAKFEMHRKRKETEEWVPKIKSLTIIGKPDEISVANLVELSLVKKDENFIPFKKFNFAFHDEPELMRWSGETISDSSNIYEELVNVPKLKVLLDQYERELDRLQQPCFRSEEMREEERNEKARCTNLENLISQAEDGKIMVSYHRCFANKGRRYSDGPSLQRCSKEVRQTSSEYYFDVDMRNAHPSIAAYITDKVLMDSANFSAIIKYGYSTQQERDEILNQVATVWQCTRGQAKILFVSLLNTQTIQGWEKKLNLEHVHETAYPRTLRNYASQANNLIYEMAKKYGDIVELSKMYNTPKDGRNAELYHKSRALGVMMEVYEDTVLNHMEKFAKERGCQFDCLIFDGALLRKNDQITEENVRSFLDELEDDILKETGIKIGLEVKPWNN